MSAAGSNPAPSAGLSAVSSTSRSPSWTTSPAATLTAVTVPAASAITGISIFIDSSSTTVSPTSTRVAGATVDAQHVGHHLGDDLDALFAGHGAEASRYRRDLRAAAAVRAGSGRSAGSPSRRLRGPAAAAASR